MSEISEQTAEWHRIDRDGGRSCMLYTLRHAGWFKGQPRMVNDVTISVDKATASTADIKPIVAAILSSLAPTAGVKVKELLWTDVSEGSSALCPFGFYRARWNVTFQNTARFEMVIAGAELGKSFHDTIDEAKSAAQADFEARIRSAIAE